MRNRSIETGDRRVKRTHFGAEIGPTWVGLTTRGDVVVSVPKCGSSSGVFARLLLLFHRLFESVAFTIHLEDFTMVS